MTGKKRRASRKRMESRNRGHRNGPTVLYTTEVPPNPIALNRAARRMFFKTETKHLVATGQPLRNVGRDKADRVVYLRGDQRFIPPYKWPRVKARKAKAA